MTVAGGGGASIGQYLTHRPWQALYSISTMFTIIPLYPYLCAVVCVLSSCTCLNRHHASALPRQALSRNTLSVILTVAIPCNPRQHRPPSGYFVVCSVTERPSPASCGVWAVNMSDASSSPACHARWLRLPGG